MMRRSLGYGIFLFALAFYLHGLYPTVSVGDSGEFITAGHTLGIPHEPGYPTYTVLSKAFTTLIPFSNPGYRENVFSAFTMAVTSALLYQWLIVLGCSLSTALVSTMLFIAAPACMAGAQASEVFALNGLLVGGSLVALSVDALPLVGLILGLGLGNHQTVLLIAPAVGWRMLRHWKSIRIQLPAFFGCFFLGISVYGALLIRAQKNPFLDVGHPDTLFNLWRVFRRADYGSLTLALGETPGRTFLNTVLQLSRFMVGLSHQITWIGIAAIVIGFVYLFKKSRPLAEVLLVSFIFLGPFFFLLANLPFDAQSVGLLERFYIAPIFCGCMVTAWALEILIPRLQWMGWIAVALIVPLMMQRARAENFRNDFRAWSYGRNNLRSLPPESVLMIDGGDDTFYSLEYLTQAEERRPDLELHDRGGVVFPLAYGSDFRQLNRDQKEERRQHVEMSLFTSGRPLYYSTMNDKVLHNVLLHSTGILYTAAPASPRLWSLYDLRDAAPWGASSHATPADYRTRALLPLYSFQQAMSESRQGQWPAALDYLSSAHEVGPDVLWLTPNSLVALHQWAYQAFQSHQKAIAKILYTRLLLWNPADATAWTNLGAVNESLGSISEAIIDYQKAILADPSADQPHFNLAVCYWKQQRWSDVIEEFNRVLAINPNRLDAHRYLAAAQAHLDKKENS